MNTKLLVMGAVAAACMVALLLPDGSTCQTTLIGVLGDVPDTINRTSCGGYFAQPLGSIRVSDGDWTVLLRGLFIRAFAVAGGIAAAFVVVARLERRAALPTRAIAATCIAMLALTAVGLLWEERGWFMNRDAVVSVDG